MTDRWQDNEARAHRIRARLADIENARIALQAATAIAAAKKEPWLQRRTDEIEVGKRKGLDGAIGMALYDPADIPLEDIADAARVPLAHVEAVRDRLKAL